MIIQIKPPFTLQSAEAKVQRAEDLWNEQQPEKIALAYTEESQWRNREEFAQGREAIVQLLQRKWVKELEYKLKKELFSYTDNKIAVHFEYEYHDDQGQWFRAHGNEHWTFDDEGLMETRDASINDEKIEEKDRRIL